MKRERERERTYLPDVVLEKLLTGERFSFKVDEEEEGVTEEDVLLLWRSVEEEGDEEGTARVAELLRFCLAVKSETSIEGLERDRSLCVLVAMFSRWSSVFLS